MNVNSSNLLSIKTPPVAETEKTAKSTEAGGQKTTVLEDGSSTTVLRSDEEYTKDWLAAINAHGTYAYIQAGDAISSLTKQIEATDSAIKSERPRLNGKIWDFSLKEGKFVVGGDGLTKDDTKHIEGKLNGNQKLVQAAASFVDAAVKSLQKTDDYQSGTTNSVYGGGIRASVFDNVAQQLNGAIDFKQFLARNEDLATYHGHNQIDDTFLGFSALDLLGSKLDSNVKAVGIPYFPRLGNPCSKTYFGKY